MAHLYQFAKGLGMQSECGRFLSTQNRWMDAWMGQQVIDKMRWRSQQSESNAATVICASAQPDMFHLRQH